MISAKSPHLKHFDFYNYPLLMPVQRTIFDYIWQRNVAYPYYGALANGIDYRVAEFTSSGIAAHIRRQGCPPV